MTRTTPQHKVAVAIIGDIPNEVTQPIIQSMVTHWGPVDTTITVPSEIWRLQWTENVKAIFLNPSESRTEFSWADGRVTAHSSDGTTSDLNFLPGRHYNERGVEEEEDHLGLYSAYDERGWRRECADYLAQCLVDTWFDPADPSTYVLAGIIIPVELADRSALMFEMIDIATPFDQRENVLVLVVKNGRVIAQPRLVP